MLVNLTGMLHAPCTDGCYAASSRPWRAIRTRLSGRFAMLLGLATYEHAVCSLIRGASHEKNYYMHFSRLCICAGVG